mgnify:CR=1 FL=1
MKILFSYKTEEERNYAAEKLAAHEIIFHQGPLQTGGWSGGGIEAVCVFVNSPVGETELTQLPDLKLIATRSTGYDHIDLARARARNITVVNVPAYGEHTVAEFAFALLLAVTRHICLANERVVRGGAFSPEGLTGSDLFGKTVGVIGTGRIGKNFIRIAHGFGLKIIAFDVFPDQEYAKTEGFNYQPLDEILRESDIISLHLPENKDTHHLINRQRVEQMKKGIIVINTARGSVIDTEALVWGLKQEIISAAGLDVLAEEGNVADEMHLLFNPHPQAAELKTLLLNHYLINHPNVLITPHMAFNTKEAIGRIIDTTIENINSFANGEIKNEVA